MSDPREIELKLDVDPASAPDVARRLHDRLGAPARQAHLVSVYYDTPRHALRDKGLSLRVRVDADSRIQTAKAAGAMAGGLFDRREWETTLTGEAPDLDALRDTPLAEVIAAADGPLSPLFETVVDRAIWQVGPDGAQIEVAFDQGTVTAGEAAAPLAEVELELKAGPPAALFGLLGEIAEGGGLRVGVVAKSERGYGLLRRKPARAVKAKPVALTPDMTAAAAVQAILRSCLAQFRRNEPLLVATRDPEALHQARVGMRRLRSALSLFKTIVQDRELKRLSKRLQHLSRQLGHARDLDVYLERAAHPDATPDRPGAAAFLALLQARRDAAYDDIVATLASPRTQRLMLDLLAWMEAGPWLTAADPLRQARRDQPVRAAGAAVLQHWRHVVKKKGRKLAALDPHHRHRVRIAGKKLRYAMDFLAPLAQGRRATARHAAYTDALERLQDSLGRLNDIQTGHDLALSLAQEPAAPADPAALFAAGHVSGRQDEQVAALIEEAVAAHARLVAAKRFWTRWSDADR